MALASIISIQTAELDMQAAGILLCLACQLVELKQRVLLIDLDSNNDIARYCGLSELEEADQAFLTATSCLANNKSLATAPRFEFNGVSLIPAGMQSDVASKMLQSLLSYRADDQVCSMASLHDLRWRYDFILIVAPPLSTAHRSLNSLANFSVWSAHAVLMPYLTTHRHSRQRLLQCAQFVRAARVATNDDRACEVWILPLDKNHVKRTLLGRLQQAVAPHRAIVLPTLQYEPLMHDLSLYQRPAFESHERMFHIRRLGAEFLDPLAQVCLKLHQGPQG